MTTDDEPTASLGRGCAHHVIETLTTTTGTGLAGRVTPPASSARTGQRSARRLVERVQFNVARRSASYAQTQQMLLAGNDGFPAFLPGSGP